MRTGLTVHTVHKMTGYAHRAGCFPDINWPMPFAETQQFVPPLSGLVPTWGPLDVWKGPSLLWNCSGDRNPVTLIFPKPRTVIDPAAWGEIAPS